MIWPLIKANLKEHRFIWMLLTGIFCFYFGMILVMYDPESLEAMEAMIAMLPIEMVKALGFENMGTTLTTYLTGYMYGFLVFLFPMIATIVIHHRMIAGNVDKGSMVYLLTTPHSRKRIVSNQLLFGLLSIVALFIVSTIFAVMLSTIIFPGELEIGKFIYLNVQVIVLYAAISSICFFGSVIANEAKHSLGIGVGVPVGFLVIQMLANASDQLHFMRYFTMYTLFQTEEILEGSITSIINLCILLAIAVIMYAISIRIFDRKNLYI